MFRGSDSKFVVKTVVPNFGHIVPVINDTVLDGVVQLENTFFGSGLFSNINIFIVHPDHDIVVFGSSDY